MKAAKIKKQMKISVLGTGGRGNLEIAGLREAFLSHLGFQSLRVVPRGKVPCEDWKAYSWLCTCPGR